MSICAPKESRLTLAVVIPTHDERGNVKPLYDSLCRALEGIDWEAIFVDDSQDATAEAVRELALTDRRLRLIRRVERRGLASACVEGIQATIAPCIAVIDADMQHDETLLPRMLEILCSSPVDVVVGSRYTDGGGVGNWSKRRARMSALATWFGRTLLGVTLSDPMSGFFMLKREAFEPTLPRLSMVGFKLLLDILASSPRPLAVREIGYQFRERQEGESKLDAAVAWEFFVLILDKTIGHLVPVRFILFALVGAIGLLFHVIILWLLIKELQLAFFLSQTVATLAAMLANFSLNNWLTYRDMRLSGWRWLGGLLSFCLVCSVGAVANLGIAQFMFGERHSAWWIAGIAGAAMSLVWNYAVTSIVTWSRAAR